MPLNIDLLQILLHMLNFVILAGGLTFLLFRPVNRFLEERAARFAAEEEKNRADAAENARLRAEYEEKTAALETATQPPARQPVIEHSDRPPNDTAPPANSAIAENAQKSPQIQKRPYDCGPKD